MNRMLAVLVCLTALIAAQSRAADRRPNILFLVADEFRHDCLGVAGHPVVKTPNFDKLAREGARFTQAYVASPVCSPSRGTMFTGRYPQVHGVTGNGKPFAAGEVALPQLLRAQGYTTGIVGKIHLQNYAGWFDYNQVDTEGSSPQYRAFLASKGVTIQGSANVAAVPDSLYAKVKTPLRVGTSVLPEELYPETWEADRAIDFIREQKAKDKPFFLYLSMLKPHSEFVIPKPYDTMYPGKELLTPTTFKPGIARPADFTTNNDDAAGDGAAKDAKPAAKRRGGEEGGAGSPARLFISDADLLKETMGHYYGAVTLVDKHMGRVIAVLDELGIRDNTIVVFTSDHGNMLGERNRMFKGVMYESSVRVPMIYRGPGVAPGHVSNAVLDNTTIMPTLLALVGLEIPAGVQGQSLAAHLKDPGQPGPGVAYSYLSDKMVRQGDWKLIVPLDSRPLAKRPQPELYNVVADPNEQNNLYGKPEAAKVQQELTALMEKWVAEKPPKVELR